MRLRDKVAVVTGGSSGIGRAIAGMFTAEGAKVVITGRDHQALKKAEIAIGPSCVSVQGDVSQLADLDRLFEQTTTQLGNIDVLVANAGVAEPCPTVEADEAHFDRIADINFKGTFFTVKKSIPHLNNKASVILISSNLNVQGYPSFAVYNATKAAIRSLARTFAAELLPRGIRVNALSPGVIDTPIFDKMGMPPEIRAGFDDAVRALVPMKRVGKPDEVAKAALFLASADSSYFTGADLVPDGGVTHL